MFDHNALREAAHHAADRYQRNGCGGAHKVYASSKAFHDARGYREMSPFRRAAYEAAITFRQTCDAAKAEFRAARNDLELSLCARRDRAALAIATIPF